MTSSLADAEERVVIAISRGVERAAGVSEKNSDELRLLCRSLCT